MKQADGKPLKAFPSGIEPTSRLDKLHMTPLGSYSKLENRGADKITYNYETNIDFTSPK